jgi:ParB/RepB/Spo0J family partition protein
MPVTIEQKQVQAVPMEDIFSDDDFNCRGIIPSTDVLDLARSIEKVGGLIQPICLQPYDKHPPAKYRIVAGHRRYAAYKYFIKLPTIPAIVMHELSDDDALILNLTENLKRKSLNIMQEARAVDRLMRRGYNEDALIAELGMSRGWIQVRKIALKLPDEIQSVVETGLLSQEQIRAIGSMKTTAMQYEAVRKIKDSKIRGDTIKLVRPKKNVLQKKKRNPAEIFEMMEHMQNTIGNGLYTRAMARCAGEINDLDLYRDIESEAEERGIQYEIPQDALSILS